MSFDTRWSFDKDTLQSAIEHWVAACDPTDDERDAVDAWVRAVEGNSSAPARAVDSKRPDEGIYARPSRDHNIAVIFHIEQTYRKVFVMEIACA